MMDRAQATLKRLKEFNHKTAEQLKRWEKQYKNKGA